MLRLLSLGFCVAVSSFTFAQDAPHPEDDFVPRIYCVSDLVLPTRHYVFKGVRLPGMDAPPSNGPRGAGGGMGGGMMGGMGGGFMYAPSHLTHLTHLGQEGQFGGGGNGYVEQQVSQSYSASMRMTMNDLKALLYSSVAVNSWSDVGGPGNISVAAGMMVIYQSEEVHKKIETLLDDLRKQGATVNPLTVRAWWLSSNDLTSVMKDHRLVDRTKLNDAIKTSGAVGQISCFDGQTVHLVTGNIRSILTGVIPVVGQVEKPKETLVADNTVETQIPKYVLAQYADPGEDEQPVHVPGRVGYQPVTETNVFGGQLQFTASLDLDGSTALLDVQSLVVAPKSKDDKPVDFHNIAKLDRLDIVVQQFATTVRLPVNKPVLVGGSTLEPMPGKVKEQQLYLIMEVLSDRGGDVPRK